MLLYLVACLCFVSCTRKEQGGASKPTFQKEYVQGYIYAEKFWDISRIDGYSHTYYVRTKGEAISNSGSFEEQFIALSEKYGDTNYNQWSIVPPYVGLADDFTSVDVTSDQDFDPEHPAGTSLGDLVRLMGVSPYKFIQSGYTELYDWGSVSEEYRRIFSHYNHECDPVDKLLKDIQQEDLLLFSPDFYLQFVTPPTLAKEHTLTITFRSEEKTVTGTVAVAF